MPDPKRRGRPPKPVLARLVRYIEGVDYQTLITCLKTSEFPTEHWMWIGALDHSRKDGILRRKKRFTWEATKPIIRLDGKAQRVDRILFSHWQNNGEPLHPMVQVRRRPECGENRCVNPSHKRLHAAWSRRYEERPPLPMQSYIANISAEDEIEDLIEDILGRDTRDLAELKQILVTYSEAEIAEALRRIGA